MKYLFVIVICFVFQMGCVYMNKQFKTFIVCWLYINGYEYTSVKIIKAYTEET